MVILSFSGLYDRILKGEKTQTIRVGVSYWRKVLQLYLPKEEREPKPLHIYWRNPRNGGLKMGMGKVIGHEFLTVADLTDEIAVLDGFQNRTELIEALREIHDARRVPLQDITPLVILRWEWTEGPVDVLNQEATKDEKKGKTKSNRKRF